MALESTPRVEVRPSLSLEPTSPTKISGLPISENTSGPSSDHVQVLCQGWVLKRKRKRMQGYARRYFMLDSTGLLAYSYHPGKAIRDQIFLPTAAISTTPGQKDIHVDSDRVTFHLRCLTQPDFEQWMAALRQFIVSREERSSYTQLPIAKTNVGDFLVKTTDSLREMSITLESMSEALALLKQDYDAKAKNKHKENHRESHFVFPMFRKSSSGSKGAPQQEDLDPPKDPLMDDHPPYDRAMILMQRLQSQHESLLEAVMTCSAGQLELSRRTSVSSPISDSNTVRMGRSISPAGTWTTAQGNRRTSLSTLFSTTDGTSSIWYDALEGDHQGAEEYLVEEVEETPDYGTESVRTPTMTASELAVAKIILANSEADEEEEEAIEEELGLTEPASIVRRTSLPAKASRDEGSLFGILKKNVGQDLSNIAFPVTFNEPLTLLQRAAEELEYHELLDKAAASDDWVRRICYVAAFAVSGYACTRHRSGRKGFTPLLGETFEDIRTKYIAEKVVHKPLVIAFHSEGPGWEFSGTSSGRTKFWGKSFEIIPTGTNVLQIGNERYTWNKPSSFTRNLMMGTKYLEHCGEMIVLEEKTKARCVLDFKESGYWASTPNVVSGTIYSAQGDPVTKIEGKWDEQLSQKLDSDHLHVLWRCSPFPRDTSDYYGFTYFGITLNEITDDIRDKLPPTDSRLRADVRALEEGDIDHADSEKTRLEEMQRERRHRGEEVQPRWFRRNVSGDWVYVGGYWEQRRLGWEGERLHALW